MTYHKLIGLVPREDPNESGLIGFVCCLLLRVTFFNRTLFAVPCSHKRNIFNRIHPDRIAIIRITRFVPRVGSLRHLFGFPRK